MKSFYSIKLVILVILASCSFSLLAQTVTTFTTPSTSASAYTVPPGVTGICVDMAGASGGNPYSGTPYGTGGLGGRVQCTIAVTPGEVLSVFVGGKGGTGPTCCTYGVTGGINGGGASQYFYAGSGGGASDIRTASGTYTSGLSSRLVVAGGGGGAGYGSCCSSGYNSGGDGGGLTGGGGKFYGSTTYSTCYNPGGGTQSAGGAAGACGCDAAGTLGVGGAGSSCYYGAGGGGGYYGGGGAYGGGGGGGSSYPAASGGIITNLIHTPGFQTGDGYVTITAPNVGNVSGNIPMCTGQTNNLVASVPGGTWSSANTAIATVGSGGLVTAISAGTVNITYTAVASCGSGYIVTPVLINPAPAVITGTPNTCPGSTTSLGDASSGGAWSSSDITKAAIGSGTGVVTGLSAGSINISYTFTSTGCASVMPFTVNPLPPAITGTKNVCASGATTSLGDAAPGGSWLSSTTTVATVTGTGLVTGVAAGNANITYILPTGCMAISPVTVNPLPSLITGTTNVCVAATTTLSDAGGGTWSSSNSSLAAVGVSSGVVTGVSAGTPNISYTLSTGCSTSIPVVVNPIPAPISGTTSACVGGSSTLSDVTPGGIWTSSNLSYATVLPVTGLVAGVSASTPNISYTLGTGCYVYTPFVVNALPVVYAVTGGGGYCVGGAGQHVGLTFGSSGINYKLYNGATLVSTVAGSNSGLDFGVQTAIGTYTVVAVNATTGCTNNMSGSAVITINPLPNVYTVSGGGTYCSGGTGMHITLSGSDLGVNYQLLVGGTPSGGSMAGTGAALDFGPQTTGGTYTAVATNATTGCTIGMSGSGAVTVNALPTAYNLSSGGGYCAGGTGVNITLSGSEAGNNYQLYLGGVPSGSPITGTGAPLNFGLHTIAGTYTVSAINLTTTCANNMNGSSVITINPLPSTYIVTGGGAYCAGGTGVHIGLTYSSTGITYQLLRSSVPVGSPLAGTNSGLDFGLQTTTGTYTVVAKDVISNCTQNMTGTVTISTNPLPTTFSVTGGGSFCAGGAGVHVGLSGSTTGIHYQLFNGTSTVGSPVSGTGGVLDFGLHNTTGTYTVVATNVTTGCSNNMTGSATIAMNPLPSVYIVSGSGSSYCAGGTGIDITLGGSDFGIRYQLYRGATAVGSAINGNGTGLDFLSQTTAGTYTITATDIATGCSISMAGSVNITINPLPTAYNVTGGGGFCAGGIGVHIGLSNSNSGISYQLSNSGGPVGAPVAGLGSVLDFGYLNTVDVYSVTATNTITGCVNTMTGTATVTQNALPNVYTVNGGGNYCFGGSGVHIGLDTADLGINYQLYFGATPSGSAVTGDGSSLDFGARTGTGTYTVVATDPITTCTSPMNSSATVGTNPLPTTHNVTGGGTYCVPGGLGVNVNLDGSDGTITYQLYNGGTPIGSAVTGSGTSIGFGLQTLVGTYNVVAVNPVTLCRSNMSGSATVNTNPQPTAQTVAGGGSYCAGGAGLHVGLTNTDASIMYQLYNGTTAIGSPVTGTGHAIDFGAQSGAGSYTVVASPGGFCQTNMTGSATIAINPLPAAYTLTGGGSYCASGTGLAVGLSGSDTAVNYQLYLGTTPVAVMAGTGSAISFGLQTGMGTYTTMATDTLTTCATTRGASGSVTINNLPLPVVYNVSGGGHYCTGTSGVHVTLAGSNTDVNYQLYLNGTATGSPMAGTGTLLDFGLHTTVGNYSIAGTDAATSCANNMADTVGVAVDPILTPTVDIAHTTPHSVTFVKQTRDTLTGSATTAGTDPMYQWFINGFPVSGATNRLFISRSFADGDSASLQVTSNGGNCGGVTSSYYVIIHMKSSVGVAQVTNADVNVSVMPNPNRGVFSVVGSLNSNDDQEVTIEVTDLLGHVVYNNKSIAKNGDVNEKVQLNVANGMYILSLRSGADSKVFHVVIAQ